MNRREELIALLTDPLIQLERKVGEVTRDLERRLQEEIAGVRRENRELRLLLQEMQLRLEDLENNR